MAGHILLVGNDDPITERIKGLLAFDEESVSSVVEPDAALKFMRTQSCQLVLQFVSGQAELELMQAMKSANPSVEVVALLPGMTHEMVSQVLRNGDTILSRCRTNYRFASGQR